MFATGIHQALNNIVSWTQPFNNLQIWIIASPESWILRVTAGDVSTLFGNLSGKRSALNMLWEHHHRPIQAKLIQIAIQSLAYENIP